MIQSENILNIQFVRTEQTPNLIVCTNRKINYFEEIKEQDKRYCNEFELLQYTCYEFNTDMKDFYELKEETKKQLFELLVEYSHTPIEKRKEEKKVLFET